MGNIRKSRFREIILSAVLTVLLIMLCGCSDTDAGIGDDTHGAAGDAKTEGEESGNGFQNTAIIGMIGYDETYNDNGVMNAERGIVYYCDPVSGYRVPLCTKVNCEHKGRTPDNMNPTCDAYFSELISGTAIIGDHLYYMSTPDGKGVFDKEFCKADRNGTNRQVIASFNDVELPTYMAYYDGYFIYPYQNQDDPDGKQRDKVEVGIILISLETEKVTRIYAGEAGNGSIGNYTIAGDNLYYIFSYTDMNMSDLDYDDMMDTEKQEQLRNSYKLELWKYNISTGEKSMVPMTEGYAFRYMGYGHIIYTSEDGNGILIRDAASGEEQKVPLEDAGYYAYIPYSEGVAIPGKGRVRVIKYGEDRVSDIGDYGEGYLTIYNITDRWVYGYRSYTDEKGEYEGHTVCCPRKDFFNGEFNWTVLRLQQEDD